MLDRSWAVGMDQEKFNIEYERMFPGADVIPDVKFWTTTGEPVYHGIPSIKDEDYAPEEMTMKVDEEGPKPLQAKIKQPGKFVCRGCKSPFDYHIQRYTHEKKCQSILSGGK